MKDESFIHAFANLLVYPYMQLDQVHSLYQLVLIKSVGLMRHFTWILHRYFNFLSILKIYAQDIKNVWRRANINDSKNVHESQSCHVPDEKCDEKFELNQCNFLVHIVRTETIPTALWGRWYAASSEPRHTYTWNTGLWVVVIFSLLIEMFNK